MAYFGKFAPIKMLQRRWEYIAVLVVKNVPMALPLWEELLDLGNVA